MKRHIILTTLILLLFVNQGCKKSASEISYINNFDHLPNRVWAGEDFWSIPLEDWQIKDGRLECIGNRLNMRTNLLSYHLKPGMGSFSIDVSCGLINKGEQEGTVGFSLGVQDKEDQDIRAACYHGKGVNTGLRTEGILFIDDVMHEIRGEFSMEDFRLNVSGSFRSENNIITLRIFDNKGIEAGKVSYDKMDDLEGLVVLSVNHHMPRPFTDGPSFWFDDMKISGTKVEHNETGKYGAILWTMYTNSRNVLKLTAQFAPVSQSGSNEAHLEIRKDGKWDRIASANIRTDSYTATFKIEDWDPAQTADYRILFTDELKDKTMIEYTYMGTIRKEPVNKPLILSGLTCQYGYGFPYSPLVNNLEKEDPDMLYFSGDQLYEGNGGYSIIRFPADRAILSYLGKWYMFGWAFGDLMRDRPTICTPDDHDVFQGNLWGNGGLKISEEDWKKYAGTTGGYIEPAEMVNVVHATQCGHLPDPFDPAPMAQNISTWYTDLVYGGVSFAIISDRIFKSGPNEVAFWEEGRKDWIKDPDIDRSKLDKPGLKLVGDRQLEFLNHWATDWDAANIKVLLSQTLFANIPTHHGSLNGILAGDLDSGGWPRIQRNRLVTLLRSCYAFHISGDQHLPLMVQYGIENFRDAGWAYCTPAICVGYQRRFLPDRLDVRTSNRPDHNLANTGEYIGGMEHKNYVYAVGNLPDETRSEFRYERAQLTSSGYGIITFNQESRDITCEAVPFLADANQLKPEDQFPGWPVTINQFDNGGQDREGDLIRIQTPGLQNPVALCYDAETEIMLLSVRMKGTDFSGLVQGSGKYNLKIGNPETNRWETVSGITADELATRPVVVQF